MVSAGEYLAALRAACARAGLPELVNVRVDVVSPGGGVLRGWHVDHPDWPDVAGLTVLGVEWNWRDARAYNNVVQVNPERELGAEVNAHAAWFAELRRRHAP